jgi:hypothetical protein
VNSLLALSHRAAFILKLIKDSIYENANKANKEWREASA